MSRRRACQGTTRAGAPCTVPPLTATGAARLGLPAHDQDWCRAHHPDLPASTRFGSRAQAREAGQQGGRPRLPRPTEVMRRLVDENAAVLLRPHFRTLGFDVVVDEDGPRLVPLGRGAVLHATSKDGDIVVSDHEDLAAQIEAAERLLDRIYGRPKQQTEVSGPEGGPVQVEAPPDAVAKSVRAVQLLQRLGQLPDAVADARDD